MSCGPAARVGPAVQSVPVSNSHCRSAFALSLASFVLIIASCILLVCLSSAAERWTGRRRQPRVLAIVRDGELVEGHLMLLHRGGQVCVDLWPLVQAVPPTDGAAPSCSCSTATVTPARS